MALTEKQAKDLRVFRLTYRSELENKLAACKLIRSSVRGYREYVSKPGFSSGFTHLAYASSALGVMGLAMTGPIGIGAALAFTVAAPFFAFNAWTAANFFSQSVFRTFPELGDAENSSGDALVNNTPRFMGNYFKGPDHNWTTLREKHTYERFQDYVGDKMERTLGVNKPSVASLPDDEDARLVEDHMNECIDELNELLNDLNEGYDSNPSIVPSREHELKPQAPVKIPGLAGEDRGRGDPKGFEGDYAGPDHDTASDQMSA